MQRVERGRLLVLFFFALFSLQCCVSSALLLPSHNVRRRVGTRRSGEDAAGEATVDIGDIVTYSLAEAREDGCKEALGVVLESLQVQPLCHWSPESNEFVCDDDQEAIAQTRIVRLLNQDGVFPEQRMAPRNIDPHGEHSEDAYILSSPTLPLPDNIYVPIRPEKEANW